MFYGIFALWGKPNPVRRAARRYLSSVGLQALGYTSREAAEIALSSVPEPHRSALYVSDHGWA